MKRLLCLLSGLLLCLLPAGCGYQELQDRLLIHGIGVDVGEDGGFSVTVRSAGSQGEECFQTQGESVLEALTSLSLSTGRDAFYAHNYLVVFGWDCAQAGLDRCLDFFVRYYNARPAVQMFLARGTAEEVLSFAPEGELLPMAQLQQVGESGRFNGQALEVEILDFVNGVKRPGSSPLLPVLSLTQSGPAVTGAAFFRDYALQGEWDLSQTRGYLAAKGELDQGEAVVPDGGGGLVTLSLSGQRQKIRARWEEGELPVFTLEVQVRGDISALSGGRDRLEDSLYPSLERAAAAQLEEEISSALEQAVIQEGCDVFGFGNLLWQRYPERWRQEGDQWPALMGRCRYQVEVTLSVLRL